MVNASLDILAIFTEAVRRELPMERAKFLDEACRGNPSARQRVETLLCAHFDAGKFLGGLPLETVPSKEQPIPEKVGTQIGPYKLLQQIGEGGFGVVFMAEQNVPVRRKVALKVIKPGMDTRQVIARFEAERQALAVMDHPHIAKVLDAGATDSEMPYFVMELVRGVPITQYCDEHSLRVRERLELFAKVCQAIEHAHTKGIIHRDIKPTNVLVTRQDDQAVVKVIDFGIAKAMGQRLTDKTLFTDFAQMIGTPLYMSPEQAELSASDIDTRSDIYSLGVLLYELLTGTTPVSKEQLKQAAFDEIRRIIREDEPPKPSTRISTAEAIPSVAAQRQTEPAKLARLMRGELDWIVMKSIEKDRGRRYGTASALAADIERYLHDEPVHACPPTAWYRLRKIAHRNRAAFLATLATALMVLAGVVALAVSNVLIRQEQERTREAKIHAEHAQQLAEKRAAEVRDGLERLTAANELFEQARVDWGARRWDDAYAAFAHALELRSDHVTVRLERAEMLALLGLWDMASADLSRSFEDHPPDRTPKWHRHALLRAYLGDRDGCREIGRRMRDRFDGAKLEEMGAELVRTCVLAADETVDCVRLVQAAQRVAANSPKSWYSQYLLGTAQYRAGQYEQAATAMRESLLGFPDWSGRALSYPVLAMALHKLGRTDEAAQALRSAVEALDRWTVARYEKNTPESWHWAIHQGATANWPIAWWDWLECHFYYREAYQLIEGRPPADDVRLRVLRARSLAGLRRQSQAVAEYESALQLVPHDPEIRLEAHRCRGYLAAHRQEWPDAAREFASAVELAPQESHLWRFQAIAHLAGGDIDGYRHCCSTMLERFHGTSDDVVAENVTLACVCGDAAVSDTAQLLALAHTAASRYYGGEVVRGAALYRAGDYQGAIDSFAGSLQLYDRTAWEWTFLALAHQRLGHTDEALRCVTEASKWIDAANRGSTQSTDPAWGEWYEPVVYPQLLREAQELTKNVMNRRSQSLKVENTE